MFDPTMPEMAVAQIDDRAAQVRAGRVRMTEVPERPNHPHERFLNQIFGQGAIAREEEGQTQPARCVSDIELTESRDLGRLLAHRFGHRCFPLYVHKPETRS